MVVFDDLGQANQEGLQTFLPLPHGGSFHDTEGRMWAWPGVQFEAILLVWEQSAFTLT